MTEELDRARFEAWVEERIRGGMKGWSLERNDFDYEHPVVFSMWQGWKAATREEVERLRKELVYEKERADGNFKSCERIKGNFSDTVNELKEARVSEKALQVELEKADKDIETWRNSFQSLSLVVRELRASETAMREALNRMLVAFVGNDDELCMECGEKQGTGSTCETCYVIGKAVEALAAAQANTKEQQ